jgi:hypothetical protein
MISISQFELLTKELLLELIELLALILVSQQSFRLISLKEC